ncbi:MAG TPA: leucine-rich repeat domain-containing protein [Verrucomicrobiae bacterium]
MKTKILILFFSSFGLLLIPARAQFDYSSNSVNHTATITAYTGSGGAVTIPSTVTFGATVYSVTAIGTNAFDFATTMTSVTIPDSVTSIDDSAFENCVLTTITIPDGVTNIGNNAFDQCPSMTNFTVAADNPAFSSVNGVLFSKDQTTLIQYPAASAGTSYAIPASVTTLGLNSFEGSSVLASMTIPNNVQNIGVGAFSNCGILTNATIGYGVTNLADYAFYNCPGLASLIFLGNAPTLGGSHVFQYVSAGAIVYYLSGASGWGSTYGGLPAVLLEVGDFTFAISNNAATVTGYTGSNNNVIIPDAFLGFPTIAIGSNALAFDTFTSVTIPDSVTSIDTNAFDSCTNLTSVMIPDSVQNLGGGAFTSCTALTNAVIGKGVTNLTGYVFDDCESLLSIVIPNNVTGIGDYAFAYCYDLTNAMIGNGVTSLGQAAFGDCGSLTSVMIPNGVTNLGETAFGLCYNLTNVTIPDSVTSLGEGAFAICSNLTSITIPNSVTSIGDEAFAVCLNLTSIIFLGNAPTLGSEVFIVTGTPAYSDPATVYYLPGTSGWGSTYGGLPTALLTSSGGLEFTLNNGRMTITGYTGSDGSVSIPDTLFGYPVTAIGGNAFANNATLTSIVIPNSVTNIGVEAFYNCAGLASVTLPDDIPSIGAETFYNCASLAAITIPASVTAIGAGAFDNCLSLTSITFLGNAPTLGNAAFSGDAATVYYYFGTTGWGATYGGLPTVELSAPNPPQILSGSAGIRSGNFAFTLAGITNQTVIVQASTNLINWQPLWTNTLSATNVIFTDSQWTNYPARFYRAR